MMRWLSVLIKRSPYAKSLQVRTVERTHQAVSAHEISFARADLIAVLTVQLVGTV